MVRRGYVQLVNGFYVNKKVRKLRVLCPSAIGMFAMTLSWCGDNLTDGIIDGDELRYTLGASDDEITALTEVGMLSELDGDRFEVHDYLSHNRSREQVMKERKRVNGNYQRRKTADSPATHRNTPHSHQTLTYHSPAVKAR